MQPERLMLFTDDQVTDRVIARLRAALKTCGFTTEEIDSIAFDTHDGVRVVMEGHIIP